MTTDLHSRSFLLLIVFTCVYLALLAAITVVNSAGAERLWLGALNLYLPQAMWLIPGIILTLCYLRMAPRLVWIPLLALLWVAGPIMGFCWPRHTEPPAPGALKLRVMTCNIKYGKRDVNYLIHEIGVQQPDLVLFQDADGSAKGALGEYLSEWQVRARGQFVVASRYPLSQIDLKRTSLAERKPSWLRCELHLGNTPITVYNVHLQTPRQGLNAFRSVKKRPWYLPEAVERFEGNVQARLWQAEAVQDLVSEEQGPVLLAGDLNSPDTSVACEMLRQVGMHDAFAQAGRGYGYSYGHLLLQHRLPWIVPSWMRIDHIMMSRHFRALRCWTGTDTASEHRPVIADIVLEQR